MEIINTEMVVSSLICEGFEQVDALLYTYVLSQLSIDNQKMQTFAFEDAELSRLFHEFVDYNGIIFQLKKGISLETDVSLRKDKILPLKRVLRTNKRLLSYLKQLDYRPIVIKKLSLFCEEKISHFDLLFSKKEKDMICQMFGINYIPQADDGIYSMDIVEVFEKLLENYKRDLHIDEDSIVR